jgi:hypothetical protein
MQRVGNADHVVDNVYIGGARAIYHIPELRAASIKHVLKLYFDEADWDEWPQDFTVCYNPLNDGELVPLETLQRGVSFIKERVARVSAIMCGAGYVRQRSYWPTCWNAATPARRLATAQKRHRRPGRCLPCGNL